MAKKSIIGVGIGIDPLLDRTSLKVGWEGCGRGYCMRKVALSCHTQEITFIASQSRDLSLGVKHFT